MNRKLGSLVLVSAVAATVSIAPARADYDGYVNLLFGKKQMELDQIADVIGDADKKAREDAEDQQLYGIEVSFGDEDWPIMMAVDLLFSNGDGSVQSTEDFVLPGNLNPFYDYEVKTTELALGIRKFWLKRFRPYLGGGIALIDTNVSYTVTYTDTSVVDGPVDTTLRLIDSSEVSTGLWLNTGFLVKISRFNLGLDVRWASAEANLSPTQEAADFFGAVAPGQLDRIEVNGGGLSGGITLGFNF